MFVITFIETISKKFSIISKATLQTSFTILKATSQMSSTLFFYYLLHYRLHLYLHEQ